MHTNTNRIMHTKEKIPPANERQTRMQTKQKAVCIRTKNQHANEKKQPAYEKKASIQKNCMQTKKGKSHADEKKNPSVDKKIVCR